MATALASVLSLTPEEMRHRHQRIYNQLCGRTSTAWAEECMRAMIETTSAVGPTVVAPLDRARLSSLFTSAKKRCFFFDYDGTLTPIVSVPTDAVPSPALLKALQGLASDPKNLVFIVSGRDATFLDAHFGHFSRIGLSGEHGCLLKVPAQSNEETAVWRDMTKEGGFDLTWKKDVLDIFRYYTERTIGSFIEEKQASVTWHYRLADASYGEWQAKECQNHLRSLVTRQGSADILIGKKNIEVRPKAINKGEIVRRLVTSLGAEADFVFCAGDDKTDEDMFRALKHLSEQKEGTITSVWVGTDADRRTYADCSLRHPGEMIDLLTAWSGC